MSDFFNIQSICVGDFEIFISKIAYIKKAVKGYEVGIIGGDIIELSFHQGGIFISKLELLRSSILLKEACEAK